MSNFESLMSAEDLKWDYIAEFTKAKRPPIYVRYNDFADILMILFVTPEQETDVFYADGNVGLLVHTETNNVVGFQIEAFKRAFLPDHAEVDRVWHLSETNVQPEEFSDFALRFENTKRQVAREVVRATENYVDDPAVEELVAALA